MSETRLPIIGAVIMTLEAGRPTVVKEQVFIVRRFQFFVGFSELSDSSSVLHLIRLFDAFFWQLYAVFNLRYKTVCVCVLYIYIET